MTKNYNIVGKYIKDMSSETPDVETYLFVRERISNINWASILILRLLKINILK